MQRTVLKAPTNVALFAPRSSEALAREISKLLNLELSPCEEREYEGGEQKMRPLIDVYGLDVFVIASLNGDDDASANDKLCRLLFFIAALKDAGAASVTACVPYLCYARKDRRTQENDAVSTRYVAALFEAVGTDRVIVLDVHNEAAFDNAFRCEAIRVDSFEIFGPTLAGAIDVNRCVVASPDIGGVKRAQRMREALAAQFETDVGFAFMEKRRLAGVVSGDIFVGEVNGLDVILYDDMIVSGGTIVRAARAARRAGARRVVVAASHAAFTIDPVQLVAEDGPEIVFVSDSVPANDATATRLKSRLRICSCAPVLANAIRRVAKSR